MTPGSVRDVSSSIGAWLIAEGYASPKCAANSGCTKTIFCWARRTRPTASKAPAAARTSADRFLVVLFSIDIDERALVADGDVAGRGRVRAHDRLRTRRRIRGAERAEHGSIDEQWVTVAIPDVGRTIGARVRR